MMSAQNLVAVAISACLFTGTAFAKDSDTLARSVTPPAMKASEDFPIDYPGGPPPAPVAGALDADDSTYNRLIGNCNGLSTVGTSVFFDTITLTNNGANDATINVEILCGADDTFLTAYDTTFNPASPLDNCVASNDDTVDLCSALTGLTVAPSASMVLVVTSFDNGELFDWTADFSGTLPVQLQSFEIE